MAGTFEDGIVIGRKSKFTCNKGHVYWWRSLNTTSFEITISGIGQEDSDPEAARSGPLCPYCLTELLSERCGASLVEEGLPCQDP
jgi:hypothetical protein